MAIPTESEALTRLLERPSLAPLRKFGSLGYLLLLHLQSELTAIEEHLGDALKARIRLRRNGTTDADLTSRQSTEDKQLEELQYKLLIYYMLSNAFSKVQSSRTPHKVVLEQFDKFLQVELQTDIKGTPWLETLDLMNPFTNFLPQRNLITMNIVSLFNKLGDSDWFKSFIALMPGRIRRLFEHSAHSDIHVLGTDEISDWFSELVVIIVPTIIVAPMFALYAIHSTWGRIACIWGFAIIFALMTRHLAIPTPDFIFTTNAAFCAVLVVFAGSALPE